MAPTLDHNLFSMQLDFGKGFNVEKKGEGLILVKNKMSLPFTTVKKKGSSYLMYGEIVASTVEACNEAKEKLRKEDWTEFHGKCLHCSMELTHATAKAFDVKLINRTKKYVACAAAKARKKSVPKKNLKQSTEPDGYLYIDISSIRNRSAGGNKFWLMIADDATPKKWSFF